MSERDNSGSVALFKEGIGELESFLEIYKRVYRKAQDIQQKFAPGAEVALLIFESAHEEIISRLTIIPWDAASDLYVTLSAWATATREQLHILKEAADDMASCRAMMKSTLETINDKKEKINPGLSDTSALNFGQNVDPLAVMSKFSAVLSPAVKATASFPENMSAFAASFTNSEEAIAEILDNLSTIKRTLTDASTYMVNAQGKFAPAHLGDTEIKSLNRLSDTVNGKADSIPPVTPKECSKLVALLSEKAATLEQASRRVEQS